jgi:threonine dehydrogenase-like Zn-dependent dehydrogenase
MDHCGHASHCLCKVGGWRGQGLTKVENDAVSSQEAAFVVIASMSIQGVRKAKLELGESAMAMGLGPLGIFAVQLCRLSGAAPVIAVDYNTHRLKLAEALGADYAFSPAAGDVAERVKSITQSKGVNAVIEVTGAGEALPQALSCSARQGRIVLLGCTRELNEGINFYESVHKTGVSIIGAHNFVRPLGDSSPGYWTSRDDLQVLLSLLGAGRLQIKPLITEETVPENASDVYGRFLAGEEGMLGVVFNWQT